MSLSILLSVLLGVGAGYFLLPPTVGASIGLIVDVGLMVLLFFVGIDIGKQKGILEKVKKVGFKVFLVPLVVTLASVLGAVLAGILLKIDLNEAGAVGAGLGWYSLSSTILLAEGLVELSALAFLANVFREVAALILIPLVAKKIGFLEAIGPAGATAMDTALPVISRSTSPQVAIISFITGVTCTIIVPILLPIVLNL